MKNKESDFYSLDEKEVKKQKKVKKAVILSFVSLTIVALISGVIALWLMGWDFKNFITNPTTILVILIIACCGISALIGYVIWKGMRNYE